MAQQLFAVTGNPQFKRRRYTDELNARLGLLPQMMEQESTQKYQSAQIENMKRSQEIEEARLGIDQERLKQSEAELGLRQDQFGLSEKAYGLDEQRYALEEKRYGQQEQQNQWARKSAEKQQELRERSEMLGMGVQAFGLGSNILGASWMKNPTSRTQTDPEMSAASGSPVSMEGGKSFFSDFNLGSTLGSGALGFAASRLGGKNKLLRMGIGAGIGGLSGYFSGGNNWSNAFGGGLLGGLAGLF